MGVDIGSVSSNFVLSNGQGEVLASVYLRTMGNPVQAVRDGLARLAKEFPGTRVKGVGTTGSGRQLAATMLGADVVKNEITCHAIAAYQYNPEVRTVIEIGGQDSKIIIIRDGIVVDFAMNTVCAAGTGSFLDQQAARLNIPIQEFGQKALAARQSARIAGRCGVFAESDMIHKQQMGYPVEDIIAGLCEALARNFLNNVGKGKDIQEPVMFQGGVAANVGLKQAFEKLLGKPVIVPQYHSVMGAVGAALLARETVAEKGRPTNFKGMDYVLDGHFTTRSFECQGCPNLCEVVSIKRGGEVLAYWGDRCRRWETSLSSDCRALA